MEPSRAVHLPADVLKAFGLGKLDDLSAEVVMNHLNVCADCRKEVSAQSGDDFLKRLRQVHGRNSTPSPVQSLSPSVATAKLPGRPTPLHNLPPELAAHPHYEILRELGRGGMGIVYLAKNKLMDRLEVLKVVNKALLDRPGSVERFLREIRSAAKLSHANVVGAYSALQLGEVLAFAMEYVEGEDLAVVVKSHGPLPVAHACFYIQQAALGLQHAFEKNMVHRDIKPQNLILAREGKKHVVKILDFGLAKVTREKVEDTGLTGEGQMLGTPDYIAPEQTLDAALADIRADIYSLGCTLYYLLSGRPPFSAASLGAILLAHQIQEAKLLNLLRPEVPEELAAVVRKMMAKQPVRRYQTPVEVARALAAFIKPGAKGGTAPKSSSELSVGELETTAGQSVAPVAENVRRAAATTQVSPVAGWETLSGDSGASAESRKSATVRKRRPPVVQPTVRKKWLIGGGVGVGVLLLALLGLWAGGVFKVKTKDGTIVLENLPADAEVSVDGETVTIKSRDGKAVAIRVAAGKKHRLQVKKEGFKVFGEDVEIDAGDRLPIRVRLQPVAAAGKPPPSTKSSTDDNGFVPLFNGKDLTGWKTHPTDKAMWEVKDGLLVGSGEKGHLFSERGDYENFHLRTEAMINDGGNSGEYFRVPFGPGFPKEGYEAQINNTHGDPQKTGSLYGIEKVREQLHKPDEWFTQEVIAEGDHLLIKVNGKTVVDTHDSRYKKGHFALQQHDPATVVKFRKIEVKELAPTGPAPPGNADHLEESPKLDRKGRIASGSWRVDEGELVHTDAVGGNCRILFGDPRWTDYDYSFEVVKTNGAFGIAALVRARDFGNVLVFDLAGWQNRKYAVECFVNGQHHWITFARPGAMAKNKRYRVLVKVRDDHFRCYVNDALIYDFRDRRQVRGAVGFRCWGAAVRVRSIKVSDPDGKVLWEGPPELE